MKLFIGLTLLAVAFGTVGCNSLVDSTPASPQSVLHIEDYYLPLKSIGTSYAYCRKSSLGADTLLMTMQGVDNSAAMSPNEVCYSTDISQTNFYLTNYYYSMNDSEAYSLGELSCGGSDKFWLDLKAPLTVGQTWKFNNIYGSSSSSSLYTAKVIRRGVQLKMPDGKLYDDVTEVIYTNSSDSTVKWFARGVGLIYSNSNTPDSDFGEEMWLLGQK